MNVWLALILSVLSGVLAFGAVVYALVRSVRSSRDNWSLTSVDASFGIRSRATHAAKNPTSWAIALMLVSLAIPWLSGSVAGISVPRSVFGIPWLSIFILIPIVLVVVTFLLAEITFQTWIRFSLTFFFALCTVIGGFALTVAALAQRLSHYSLMLDTLLRGVSRASTLLPAVRVGFGALVFTLASCTGCILSAKSQRVPESGPEQAAFSVVSQPEVPFFDRYFGQ
jgi:hypothetical protein